MSRPTDHGISLEGLIFFALSALVVIVYSRVSAFPFIRLDDDMLILRNPALKSGLTAEAVGWAFTTGLDGSGWIPLTWLSRLLDVSLFGMNAGMHHLVNVLFHLVNTLLLFVILRNMTGTTWRGAVVAALFAVHPLHVESVAWVAERKDVLSAFFGLLALGAYVRYSARPGGFRYLAALVLFLLALLSKPMAVTLPFALLLLDYWPLGRFGPGGVSGKRLFLEKIPFVLLSIADIAASYRLVAAGDGITSLAALPMWARGANALLAYGAYLRMTVWPQGLAVFYPHPETGPDFAKVAMAGFFIFGLSSTVAVQARRRPYLACGWFWFLGTLIPAIGLVQNGLQGMADRFMYVPLIGLFIVAAWSGGELLQRLRVPKGALVVGAVACLAALTAQARVQVSYWKGNTPLLRHALSLTRDNWVVHYWLGETAFEEGPGRGSGRESEGASPAPSGTP